MAGEAAEVRVKLVLDHQAASQQAHIAGADLEHMSGGAKQLEGSMQGAGGAGSLAMGAVGGAVALMGEKAIQVFHAMEDAVKDFVMEAMDSAEEAITQTKAVAGVLAMIDSGGHSIDQLNEYAADLHDELEGIGIAAGVATGDLQEAFAGLASRTTKSVDEVLRLTDAMATAGKAVPGGVGALSAGFEAMEMGVIKAKNPIVGLIAATGTLHGNAKSVAAQLMKMSPEDAMKLGEKAIDAMAKKMEDAPASYAGLLQSLKDVKSNVMEAMGRPILDSLIPPLSELKSFLLANRDAIEHFAQGIGEEIGTGVSALATIVKELYSAVSEHWGEWVEQFHTVFGEGEGTFHYMVEHAPEIGRTLGQVLTDMLHAAQAIERAWEKVAGAFSAVAKTGALGSGAKEAAYMSDNQAIVESARAAIKDPYFQDYAQLQKWRASFVENALSAGQDAHAAGEEFDKAWAWHAETVKNAHAVDAAAVAGDVQTIAAAYNKAGKDHNEAMQRYTAFAIAGNQNLIDALNAAGPDLVTGGFGPLIKMMEEAQSGTILSGLKSTMNPKLDIKPSAPSVNFNNNTFNIKQDFREQDPDRIAIVFRKDVATSATSRVQSKVATPFGF